MKLNLCLSDDKSSESSAPIDSVKEFANELVEYMKANPSEASKFAKAWSEADNKGVAHLLNEFMSEYEDHSGDPRGALDHKGRP